MKENLKHRRKLTDVQHLEIQMLYATGNYSYPELARRFGVSRGHVARICLKGRGTADEICRDEGCDIMEVHNVALHKKPKPVPDPLPRRLTPAHVGAKCPVCKGRGWVLNWCVGCELCFGHGVVNMGAVHRYPDVKERLDGKTKAKWKV